MATSTLGMQKLQHGPAQDGIDSRLVALALALEPHQHIRVDANRRCLLGRLIERIPGGLLPELVRQRRDVAAVDLAVRQDRQRRQFGFLDGRQRWEVRQVNLAFHGLAYSVSFP